MTTLHSVAFVIWRTAMVRKTSVMRIPNAYTCPHEHLFWGIYFTNNNTQKQYTDTTDNLYLSDPA